MPLDRRSAVLLRTVYTVTVIGIFLYFLMWQVNFYLAESIKQGIYLFFPPVLLAGVLYFRKLKDGIEIKLVAAYLLWVVITRIINGDRVLSKEYLFVLDLSLMLPFMSLGLVLDRAGRRRVLNWLSVILGVYFFVLGVLCIYTYITSRDLINPITGGYLTAVFHKSKSVITALDTNPNTIAFWFMMPFLLMLYQLFSSKSKMLRVLIAFSGLTDLIVIALTQCRSILAALSICLGILGAILAGEKLRVSRWGAALLILFVFASSCAVSYMCFHGIYMLADRMRPSNTEVASTSAQVGMAAVDIVLEPTVLSARIPVSAQPEPQSVTVSYEYLNRRLSGRLEIFRGAYLALKEEPAILFRGQSTENLLVRTNAYLIWKTEEPKVQFHNYLLQVLMLTGIPGLFLALSISLSLLFRCIRSFMDRKNQLKDRVFGLCAIACLLFGQMESGFFNYTDARTLFFYLTAGIVFGISRNDYNKPAFSDN